MEHNFTFYRHKLFVRIYSGEYAKIIKKNFGIVYEPESYFFIQGIISLNFLPTSSMG